MCSSYLLPHLLPSKPGLDTHGMRHPKANTIQRVFKMSFVPVGFWQRFIARMLISLAEMDLQVASVSAGGRGRGAQGTCSWACTGRRGPLLEGLDCNPLDPGGQRWLRIRIVGAVVVNQSASNIPWKACHSRNGSEETQRFRCSGCGLGPSILRI